MGSYKNTDNLGNILNIGDKVGYIYGSSGHYRIHSGTVIKLCEKTVWIKPDEYFKNDARISEKYEEYLKKMYPDKKMSKFNKLYLAHYGRVVKLNN